MAGIMDRLKGDLIVSCQSSPGDPTDSIDCIVAFALAAVRGGAQGLRLNSPEHIAAVRAVTDLPIIGIQKRTGQDGQTLITGELADIPLLIEAGADAIHPIQAKATGMEPDRLKRDFGERVAFCGGVDAQELLVNGQPEEVAAAVIRLREIFPTGLIVSPSHEAILPDIPPANVEALFAAMRG